MPSNILFSSEDNAKLNLLLTHSRVAPGAGSMILRVNGEYANSLPLRSSYWRDTQLYRLNIPMRDFNPGINKVSVEIYGPVDIRNQQRRFAVYMSEKSNLKLSSWVKFIPTEGHHVSPQDFFAISDDCGKKAQLTVSPNDPVQLKNLWRLISHVSHHTKKAMPGLLVTTKREQSRPFHVIFGDDVPSTPFFNETKQDSQWDTLKQRLFEFVAHNESEHEDSESYFIPTNDNDIAYVKHTNDEGWYRIHMLPTTQDEFASFLRNENIMPPAGALSEREFSSSTSQYIKAAFIGYPAGLAVVSLLIIWWMSAFVTRALEARR
ncbi:cellulose biosynthesis cyclic di-GMP-binding regulatory protein BcsB [Enterovibrio nigricans]|uniref:Cellulose synthase subunit n=1 Tax=Enterovibrio nigricans DSM 22720 TaxID=1121868 RepID=A0A1T4W3Q8_9GAMM|nr:cellulose synthase subunit [Enterovibrio nigricans DSM 22720]